MSIGPPSNPALTPGTVVFDSTEFLTSYPQFKAVSVAQLTGNFNLACLQLNNTAASVVQDAPTRQYLLYLLTAHMTALLNGENGNPPNATVGRIMAANEGSVSAQLEWAAAVSNSASFYLQTQYGAIYWQAVLPYRTARYIPASSVSRDFGAWNAWPQ